MTRSNLRLVVPLVALLTLVACGEDDPAEGADGAGGASSSTSAEPESSASESSESEPEESSDDSGGGGDVAASCAEIEATVTGITSQYPDGVGLADGEVPGPEQIEALTALTDGMSGLEVEDSELSSLRDGVVDAAQVIVDRGETGAAVTEEDSTAFTGAMSEIGIFCEGAS